MVRFHSICWDLSKITSKYLCNSKLFDFSNFVLSTTLRSVLALFSTTERAVEAINFIKLDGPLFSIVTVRPPFLVFHRNNAELFQNYFGSVNFLLTRPQLWPNIERLIPLRRIFFQSDFFCCVRASTLPLSTETDHLDVTVVKKETHFRVFC